MIESVHIKGFQSLADVELPLGRFTVIQGRSNSGKSAVIRALRAVVTNGGNMRGTGGSFIRHGSKECSVEIRRAEGVLTWRKAVSKNDKTTYTLNGKTLTTGTEVPTAVAEFLRLGDIVIDEANSLRLNVNFQGGGRGQGQFEPPFLVVDRPGSYLAKVFALLNSANVLYEAQAVAKKDARAKGGKLKTLREVAETERARLAELAPQHAGLKAAADAAAAAWAEAQSIEAEKRSLHTLWTALVDADTGVKACDDALKGLGTIDPSVVDVAEAAAQQLATARMWQTQLATVDQGLAEVEAQIAVALPPQVAELLTAAEATMAQAKALRVYYDGLVGVDRELAALDVQMTTQQTAIATAEQELHALVDELGTCPLCNQAMVPELVTA